MYMLGMLTVLNNFLRSQYVTEIEVALAIFFFKKILWPNGH